MPKPKPLPIDVFARQQAEKELPRLQQKLEKLLEKNETDEGMETDETDETDGEKEEVNTGYDEEDAEDEEMEDHETEDDESEGSLASDNDEGDERDHKGYNDPLPRRDQIEIEGVCVVTEALFQDALSTYNQDAVDWIKLHRQRTTRGGDEATEAVFAWIQTTLAAHRHRPFGLSSSGKELFSRYHHSFPSSLLEGEGHLFKALHAIVFSTHPRLAQCYVDAASQGYIPATSIQDCLKEKFYIGRSKDIKNRLAQHLSPNGGVNRYIRAAKVAQAEAQSMNGLATEWRKGALVTFATKGFGYVPTGIWSAIETSLIACHGSTVRPCQAQHNIVDLCRLPRPRLKKEIITRLYEQWTAGVALKELSEESNISPAYIRKLMTGACCYKELSQQTNLLHDWLLLLKLRMARPCEQPVSNDRCGRIIPLYPNIPALDFGYTRAAARTEKETAQLDKILYPLRPRGTSEAWDLRDYAMERTSDSARPLAPLKFPLEEYRKQAEAKYAESFTRGIPVAVWERATAEET